MLGIFGVLMIVSSGSRLRFQRLVSSEDMADIGFVRHDTSRELRHVSRCKGAPRTTEDTRRRKENKKAYNRNDVLERSCAEVMADCGSCEVQEPASDGRLCGVKLSGAGTMLILDML